MMRSLLKLTFGLVVLVACGCEKKHSAVASSPPLPRQITEQPVVSEAQRAEQEQQFKALLARLDAKVGSTAHSAWAPPPEIDLEVVRAASGAQVDKIGCATEFCRYAITTKTAQSRKLFAQQLLVHGAVIFDYPVDRPLTVVAYVFKPETDMRSL